MNLTDEDSAELSVNSDEIKEKEITKPPARPSIMNKSLVETEESLRNSRARIERFMSNKLGRSAIRIETVVVNATCDISVAMGTMQEYCDETVSKSTVIQPEAADLQQYFELSLVKETLNFKERKTVKKPRPSPKQAGQGGAKNMITLMPLN